MADPYIIYSWYWQVQDTSPSTHRYFTSGTNGLVPTSDSAYVTWTGRGNVATIIDTMAHLYQVFNDNCVLAWPSKTQNSTSAVDLTVFNPPPRTLNVNMTASGKKVILPRMDTPNGIPIGQISTIVNTGSTNSFSVVLQDGTTLVADVLPGRNMSWQLAANTSANGVVQVTATGTTGGAFSQIVIREFSGTGTVSFVPTVGMKFCIVEVCGGGGGAGGVVGATGLIVGSAGGGSGAYARRALTALQVGASQTMTLGAVAAGGTGSSNGANGSTTSFGSLVSASGGFGGPSSVNAFQGGLGGNTGVGDVVFVGNPGMPATQLSTIAASVNQYCAGGNGGASYFGNAGRGAYAVAGAAATGGSGANGSGGGGAHVNAAALNGTGGDGSSGRIVVTEFI